MPRPVRLDLPGLRHHVMNRGGRRARVFPDDAAGQAFVDLLAELPARFGVRVHGYALVGNHFHLMLECPTGGLSQAMQYLQSRYSRWLNQHHDWDGPVWRDRYRSRVVDDETSWRQLLAYLHLNPVRAGLAPDLDSSRWTSHRAYVGLDPVPSFLFVSELQDAFGTTEAYRSDLDEALATQQEDLAELYGSKLWGRTANQVHAQVRASQRTLTVDQAWERLTQVTGLDRAALCAAPRGRRGNPARWVTLWWLYSATELSQAEVATEVGTRPSFASRAVTRVRTRPLAGSEGEGEDRLDWMKWADTLQEWLVKRDLAAVR